VKRCFKCGTEKPLSEFYAHKMMADGHLGKCKDCTKLDMRIDRTTKPRVREYDRNRSRQPHRIALSRRIAIEWQEKHPDRKLAHMRVGRAVRGGKLQKPTLCEGCGLPKRLEGHHPDYAKPLVVVWLCKPCHAIADKIRRATERADEAGAA
jgi:hypothetical protein